MKTLHIFDDDTIKWRQGDRLYCLHIHHDNDAESPREWDGQLTTMACWHRRYHLGDKIQDADPEVFWRRLVRENVPWAELMEKAKKGDLPGIRVERNSENPALVDIYETYYLSTVLGKSEAEESLEYEAVSEGTAADYIMDDLTIRHCMTLMAPYALWMPLWLYDHSGLTISCSEGNPFSDRWDTSCVGRIVAMKGTIMKETLEYVLDENGERIREEHEHDHAPSTWSWMTRPLTEDTWRDRAQEILDSDVEIYDAYLTGDVYGYTLYDAETPADTDDFDSVAWEEIESCYGFYGDDPLENGICGNIGRGLAEAVAAGEIEKGKAKLCSYSYYRL